MNVETIRIPGIAIPVSRIGLGTWAIGGWMWGGSDDTVSIATIRRGGTVTWAQWDKNDDLDPATPTGAASLEILGNVLDTLILLDDDQIDSLLDAIDDDPIASDNADGLTELLQDTGVLPDDVEAVGADLVDGPPAFFVLPD